MKKLLMMVLPGVLALSISASMAMEKDLAEKVPGNAKVTSGNAKVTSGFTKAQEQQLLDIVSELIVRETNAQNKPQQNTYNELYPRPERIDGTDNIPVWVLNP